MSIDWIKVGCIRKQRTDKIKKLNTEKDEAAKKQLRIEIKILELKEMIEKIQ